MRVLAGTSIVQAGRAAGGGDAFPLPGVSGTDDNNNSPEGGQFQDEQGIIHPAFMHPLDFFSAGTWYTGVDGKTRALIAEGQQKFAQYSNYWINGTVQWPTFFGGGLMVGGGPQLLVDEPDETLTEPAAAAGQGADTIFDASEVQMQFSARSRRGQARQPGPHDGSGVVQLL